MDDSKVVDHEIDEAEAIVVNNSTPSPSQAELIVSLTNLINSNLVEIDKLEEDFAKHKEMIDSVLDNDATYKEHEKVSKEAARIKSNTKKEIFKKPDVKHVVEKLAELRENIKDTKDELSNYIQEYAQASGQNYFEAADGTIQEIVYVAKLRKKSA